MKCLTSLNTRMIRRIFVISINLSRTHFMLSELKQLFRCLYCADQKCAHSNVRLPLLFKSESVFLPNKRSFWVRPVKNRVHPIKEGSFMVLFFFYSFHPSARVTHSCRMLLCRLAVARLIGYCHRLLKFRERDIFAFMSWLEF